MPFAVVPKAYMLSFLVAFLVTMVSTEVVRRLAIRLHFFDHPADHKFHRSPVPYMGGVALLIALVLAILDPGLYLRPLAGVLLLAGVICGVGLADDYVPLGPWVKLAAQIAVACAAFFFGIAVNLFGSWPLDLAVTALWIVIVTNAINLLDNMDGLAPGISAIAAFFFTLLAVLNGQYLVADLAAAICGASLAFLFYNLPPAEIFLGDAGSMPLGFLLAAVGIKLKFTNVNVITFGVPILILGVAVFDTALVVFSRLTHGVRLFQGGKDHSSHRLVRIGMSPRDSVLTLYLVTASLGFLAVVLSYSTPLQALGILGAVATLAIAAGVILAHVPAYEAPPERESRDRDASEVAAPTLVR